MTDLAENNWDAVCTVDEIAPGSRKEVTLSDGTLVLVINADGELFACCADCPHQDTALIEGDVTDTVLTCTLHFWQWDLRDGKPLGVAEMPLTLFGVKAENGH